jgi:hypothetical protein
MGIGIVNADSCYVEKDFIFTSDWICDVNIFHDIWSAKS